MIKGNNTVLNEIPSVVGDGVIAGAVLEDILRQFPDPYRLNQSR